MSPACGRCVADPNHARTSCANPSVNRPVQDLDQQKHRSAPNGSADRHAQTPARYTLCAAKTINHRIAANRCCCGICRFWRSTYVCLSCYSIACN
ncbi:hypothetical protein ASPFODRAFT_469299 [Aspergillus luchuensis CBS 106.47]|uniref:Uncharacterized protein n=1 Tax=Aspergillus luchuensis (strain CBS 106.47) TaxID=1137211 RepID=A0A1M3SZW4_ASPLC|nr:hypothetical protein ASPFODRAFT_469299 [Aspergillus luchuensis CBS 106.47]